MLDGEDLKDTILSMTRNAIADRVAMAFGEAQDHWTPPAAGRCCAAWRGCTSPKDTFQFTEDDAADKTQQDFTDLFLEAAEKTYEAKEAGDSARPSCGSWSGSSCCAWWTSTGWTTSTPWTT